MTYAQLLDGFAAILRAKLPTYGPRVYVDKAWPTGPDLAPSILVASGPASWQSLNGANTHPEYQVVGTVIVAVRMQGRTEDALRATLGPAGEAILTALLSQPNAVLNLPGVEEIPRITRTYAAGSEGDRLEGQVSYSFECIWQEEYPPDALDKLTKLHVVVDAIDPTDPLAPNPPFEDFPAPAAPPRDQGPDGKPEVIFDITLPE